jgi:hypothetical protein
VTFGRTDRRRGGTLATLTLSGAAPGAPATLVIGLSALGVPFKGGTLVPQPDVLLAFTTGAGGGVALSAAWPAALPSGTQTWFQWWIADAGGPAGFAASNAVLGNFHGLMFTQQVDHARAVVLVHLATVGFDIKLLGHAPSKGDSKNRTL